MSTGLERDLFLAILSMDAYNRGYGPGISGLSDDSGTKIGNAVIIRSKGDQQAKEVGFFAIAYNVSNVSGFSAGDRVISYRGTDKLLAVPFFSPIGGDAWNGYGGGLGKVVDGTAQAALAIDFYKGLASSHFYDNSITVTGHSLGGGLAGLVGALYHRDGVLFDNMAFEDAAEDTHALATSPTRPLVVLPGGETLDPNADRDAVKALVYPTGEVRAPLIAADLSSKLKTVYGAGEFLQVDRLFQDTPDESVSFGNDIDFPGLDTVAAHSMSSLVIALYGKVKEGSLGVDWKTAANSIWSALYDDSLAQGLVTQVSLGGEKIADGDFADAMRTAIAYSAISEGERPFGDTALVAMFNDATDMGKVLGQTALADRFGEYAADIARSVVQFAGALALNDVEASEWASAGDGILLLSDRALRIDYTDLLWADANGGTAPQVIAGQTALLSSVLAAHEIDAATVSRIGARFGDTAGDGVSDAFDQLTLALVDGGYFTINHGDTGKGAIFVGLAGGDTVDGSMGKDLILGDDGADFLTGGEGNDVLVGGSGSDTLAGGFGSDVLDGGDSDDSYYWFYGDSDDAIIDASGYDVLTIDLSGWGIYRDEVVQTGNAIYIRDATLAIDGEIEQIEILGAADDEVVQQEEQLYGTWTYYDEILEEWVLDDNIDDDISSTAGVRSYMYGLGGDDRLYGSDAFDVLHGDDGDDTLGGFGLFNGGNGDDVLDGSLAPGEYYGQNGNDVILSAGGYASGGDGNDTITADAGYADGEDGADSITGYGSLSGGNGDDTIGGSGYLWGGDGNDSVWGSGRLHGGAGSDTLTGTGYLFGDGNPFLNEPETAAGAADLIIAGDASNTIVGGGGNDTLYGGNESDQFLLRFIYEHDDRETGVDRIFAGNGNDWAAIGFGGWYIDGGIGNDTVSFLYIGREDGITVNLATHSAQNTGAGSQTLISIEAVEGSSFDDVIKGNAYANTLSGGDGDDLISTGANAEGVLDIIYGGAGDDTIQYEGGAMTLYGGDGLDTLEIRVAGDTQWNLAGEVENFVGGTGNDSVAFGWLSENALHLRGGDGNDTFNGNNGKDRLSGEAGDDLLFGSKGNDTLDGGADFDSVSYYYASGPLDADLSAGVVKDGYGATDTLISIERLYAGAYDDRVLGGAGNDILVGNGGNDTLSTGLGGQDELYGGGGNDTYIYESGNRLDMFEDAGGGVDTLDVRVSTGSYWTLGPIERFIGGQGNDEVAFTDTAEIGATVSGMDGNDTLGGSWLSDQISGDRGDDLIRASRGSDALAGGAGWDVVTYLASGGGVEIDLAAGWAMKIGDGVDTLSGFESVVGSVWNDTVTGSAAGDTLSGDFGDDWLSGGAGSDLIDGGAGADTLLGGARWDTLRGGEGNDILDGGADNDAMYGGIGNDTYVVDHVGDRVYENLNEGNDTVKAWIDYSMGAHIEVLYLSGMNNISGTGNGLSNAMNGNSGNNTLSGGLGNDSLYGWEGNDSLVGGNDHDRLSGGNGNDTLIGGHGQDQIGGGAGADDFVFSSVAVNGHDHIADFEHGLDRLVFTGSDYGFAAGHVLTNAEFTVGATAAGAGAQFIWDSAAGKLWWDSDGSGAGAAFELSLVSGSGVTVTREDLYFT